MVSPGLLKYFVEPLQFAIFVLLTFAWCTVISTRSVETFCGAVAVRHICFTLVHIWMYDADIIIIVKLIYITSDLNLAIYMYTISNVLFQAD